MMYVSMFPQLVAGPIVRYQTVQDQMTGRVFKWEQMWSGITRFAFGLFKKTAVANTVGALSGKYLDGQLADLTSPEAWIAIAFFSIQLYFDFSGYSDMAIGLARMFGFELEENFRHPYAAVSVADFYRRWHISLGRFFREYVYIPLGGNRRLQDRNIFIVWALTGLWHGASWNFVIWGMYFGVFMIIEKYMGGVLEKTPRFLRHTYTLILIVFSRSIFYYVDFNQLQEFWGRLFTGPVSINSGMQLDLANNCFILLLAVLLCVPWDEIISEPGERFRSIWKWLAFPTVLLMMGISTLLLVGDTYNPFIYFRF